MYNGHIIYMDELSEIFVWYGNECYWKYLYGEKRKLVDVCTMDILFMDVC